MLDKKVKINFPKATDPPVDGTVIPIKESTERWSDILLEDGTTLRNARLHAQCLYFCISHDWLRAVR